MTGLTLVRLTPEQVAEIHPIMRATATDLATRYGRGHWSYTPSLDRLAVQAERRHVFAVRRRGRAVATLALNRKAPGWYHLERFRFPADPAAYLSNLAVLPGLQGQGIGRWCVSEAERMAAEWGCLALRFDAYDSPAGAAPFYRKCGFVSRGPFVFNRVPLILFEKTWHSAPPRRPGA
ncbi:MAG: GNAT family N-acetyltransferase [Gemmatimonadota bacterium]